MSLVLELDGDLQLAMGPIQQVIGLLLEYSYLIHPMYAPEFLFLRNITQLV